MVTKLAICLVAAAYKINIVSVIVTKLLTCPVGSCNGYKITLVIVAFKISSILLNNSIQN